MSPSAKEFRCIFVVIPQHQKRYLVYVPNTRNIIPPYDVAFYERFSSISTYTSQPNTEAMAMCPAVSYTPYAKISRENKLVI